MPAAPEAAGTLRPGTGCFSRRSITAETGRAVWSATPPGGKGTTRLIGRAGYSSCAPAPSGKPTSAASSSAPATCLILSSLDAVDGIFQHAEPSDGNGDLVAGLEKFR